MDRRDAHKRSGYDWTIWFGWLPCGMAMSWYSGAFLGNRRISNHPIRNCRFRAGLDYRLTYTHPVTKKRIVICPQAVRDELRARGDGALARSDA